MDDRIRVSEGRLQRYGTQFDWDDDGAAMLPMIGIEDPGGVDARRAAVGLGPLTWRQPPPPGESAVANADGEYGVRVPEGGPHLSDPRRATPTTRTPSASAFTRS